MKPSKWYLVQGQNDNGVYAQIREESTDLIVASFPAVAPTESNQRAKDLHSIVEEHNKAIKCLITN